MRDIDDGLVPPAARRGKQRHRARLIGLLALLVAVPSVTVGSDGVVTAKLPGNATPQQLGNIELASFINPAGLEPKGQNLYAETAASGAPATGAPGSNQLGTVKQGFVETSNVNVVEELIGMIQTQRAYELNSKAIQTSDQMLQKLGQL